MTDSNQHNIKTTITKPLYWGFVFISFLVCLFFIWINAEEAIERFLGHDTLFKQMTWFTDYHAIIYSIIYLTFGLVLMGASIFFYKKSDKKKILIISIIIWLIALVELYTDSLFRINY